MTKAFTLVEVLATTAIIGTLIGITVPALGKMKEKGRITRCQSNLHQWGIGMQGYYADYHGYPPFNNELDFVNGMENYVGDKPRLKEDGHYVPTTPYRCPSDDTDFGAERFNEGLSYYYLRFGVLPGDQFYWNNFDYPQSIVMMDYWPRHYKKANYLFGSGAVKLVYPGFPEAP